MSLSTADIINLNDFPGESTGGYQNLSLATVNDHAVRLSVMTNPFYWHYHPNSDETFLVIEGSLLLDLEDTTLELSKGQMITVPANMVHRTRPKGSTSINITVEKVALETVRFE